MLNLVTKHNENAKENKGFIQSKQAHKEQKRKILITYHLIWKPWDLNIFAGLIWYVILYQRAKNLILE